MAYLDLTPRSNGSLFLCWIIKDKHRMEFASILHSSSRTIVFVASIPFSRKNNARNDTQHDRNGGKHLNPTGIRYSFISISPWGLFTINKTVRNVTPHQFRKFSNVTNKTHLADGWRRCDKERFRPSMMKTVDGEIVLRWNKSFNDCLQKIDNQPAG